MDHSIQKQLNFSPFMSLFHTNPWVDFGRASLTPYLLPGVVPSSPPIRGPFFYHPPPTPRQFEMMEQSAATVSSTKLRHLQPPTTESAKSNLSDGPVFFSPPVTPIVPLVDIASSPLSGGDSTGSTTASLTATTSTPPIRVSSRNRRPPAFIEGETTCPICGCLLRASELAEHYEKERHGLSKFNPNESVVVQKRVKSLRNRIPEKAKRVNTESRKNILARVRLNRQDRVSRSTHRLKRATVAETTTAITKPNTGTPLPNPTVSQTPAEVPASTSQPPVDGPCAACPVCGVEMACSTEEMTMHVESCLSKQSSGGEGERGGESGSSSGEDYETYTWCGQTRIRATSLLDDNELAASGFNKVKCEEEGEDEDLVVDEDVSNAQFGGAQYTEVDVIPCTSDHPAEAKVLSAIRQAVISDSSSHRSSSGSQEDSQRKASASKWSGDVGCEEEAASYTEYKCLICMDRYSCPLVSVLCWHVYCEECWLRTLGVKKLCPQCNLITSPSDLRRIYL